MGVDTIVKLIYVTYIRILFINSNPLNNYSLKVVYL